MEPFDPRQPEPGSPAPHQLPRDIDAQTVRWMRDYSTRVTRATGLKPALDAKVQVVSRDQMLDVMAGLGAAVAPNVPGPSSWLMEQLVRQVMRMMVKGVLGLYVPEWQAGGAEPAIYVVGENVEQQAAQLGLRPEDLAHYVAFHEATHQWQFSAHPWLNTHLPEELKRLTDALTSIEPREFLVNLVMARGDLMAALPAAASLQATMSLIEGYAEFMTEELGVSSDPKLGRVAQLFDERRAAGPAASRNLVQQVVDRILGMEAKRAQYAVGKSFCEAVHAQGGQLLLDRVWESPATLPTPAEMAHPQRWVSRMSPAGGSRAA